MAKSMLHRPLDDALDAKLDNLRDALAHLQGNGEMSDEQLLENAIFMGMFDKSNTADLLRVGAQGWSLQPDAIPKNVAADMSLLDPVDVVRGEVVFGAIPHTDEVWGARGRKAFANQLSMMMGGVDIDELSKGSAELTFKNSERKHPVQEMLRLPVVPGRWHPSALITTVDEKGTTAEIRLSDSVSLSNTWLSMRTGRLEGAGLDWSHAAHLDPPDVPADFGFTVDPPEGGGQVNSGISDLEHSRWPNGATELVKDRGADVFVGRDGGGRIHCIVLRRLPDDTLERVPNPHYELQKGDHGYDPREAFWPRVALEHHHDD